MDSRFVARHCAAAVAAAALLLVSVAGAARAQAPIPRTADGRPDFSGIWQAINTADWNIQDHSAGPGVPAGQGVVEGNEIPYRPEALEQRRRNFENRETADPVAQCKMAGVPRSTYLPYPFQIVQTPTQVTILYEYVHSIRNIYLTGEHPPGPIEWWLGDSRGRWEGDTLVVDVVHFTPHTWFDRSGNFHSEELHVVERYTLTSPDHILYEVTIEDPKVFTRPWRMSMPLYRRKEPNIVLLEYECYADRMTEAAAGEERQAER